MSSETMSIISYFGSHQHTDWPNFTDFKTHLQAYIRLCAMRQALKEA